MEKTLKEQFLYWCNNWYRTDIKIFGFELLYTGPRTSTFLSCLEAGNYDRIIKPECKQWFLENKEQLREAGYYRKEHA